MNYKKMSFISGVIVFVAIIGFFSSILWLSGKNILFSEKYIVYFKFDDVVGLRDRSAVYMRGYRIGWTKDVFFEPDGVRIRIDIKERFNIPTDSVIEINTLNLIGEKAITITPGTASTNIKAGDIVWGKNKDIMIVAKKILLAAKEKIEAGDFNQQLHDISIAVASFRDFINGVNRNVQKIDIDMYHRQINEIGLASRKLTEFLSEAGKDTHTFTENSSVSMAKINQTLEKLDATLRDLTASAQQIREITEKINKGEGTVGKLLNDEQFIQKLDVTITQFNEFLADIKKNPKKYVRFSIF